jgi:hypothetical protein
MQQFMIRGIWGLLLSATTLTARDTHSPSIERDNIVETSLVVKTLRITSVVTETATSHKQHGHTSQTALQLVLRVPVYNMNNQF